jgi:hypothetical protein
MDPGPSGHRAESHVMYGFLYIYIMDSPQPVQKGVTDPEPGRNQTRNSAEVMYPDCLTHSALLPLGPVLGWAQGSCVPGTRAWPKDIFLRCKVLGVERCAEMKLNASIWIQNRVLRVLYTFRYREPSKPLFHPNRRT